MTNSIHSIPNIITPLHLSPGKILTLRTVPMSADTNANGDIFGGWIMSHVDIAGSIPAKLMARGRVVTVAVNSFVFKQAVFIGDIVSFYAEVLKIGRTSITIEVEVYAQRNPENPKLIKVTEATLTYVAIDDNRKPCKIITSH